MKTLFYMNNPSREEETMAVQIMAIQILLLVVVYIFFKTESLQPLNKRPLFIQQESTVETSAQPYSSRNIFDIMWSCQPDTLLSSGNHSCTSYSIK